MQDRQSERWRLGNPHIPGHHRIVDQGTESLEAQLWITNDLPDDMGQAVLSWEIVNAAGQVIAAGEKPVDIAADSSEVVERFFRPLGDDPPGDYSLRLLLVDREGVTLSENFFDYEVVGS